MSQENSVSIKTTLYSSDEAMFLKFHFQDKPIEVRVDQPDQGEQLRGVFNKIAELLLQNNVELTNLEVIGTGQVSAMAIEVFSQYVSNLNEDIQKLRRDILSQEKEIRAGS